MFALFHKVLLFITALDIADFDSHVVVADRNSRVDMLTITDVYHIDVFEANCVFSRVDLETDSGICH